MPEGIAYWHVAYSGNMAEQRYIGKTKSEEHGELTYFDWAPTQWNNDLKYRNVKIVFPLEVASEHLTEDQKNTFRSQILTEPEVHKRNKIDYFGTKIKDNTYYLTIQFYQEKVTYREPQRIQFYFPSSFIQIENLKSKRYLHPYTIMAVKIALVALIITMIGASIRYYRRKYKSKMDYSNMVTFWEEFEWTPPVLLVGSYAVPNKVAPDLHPVEVALLMDFSLERVAAIMLAGLEAQGIIRVVQTDPLHIHILTSQMAKSKMEEDFLTSFDSQGFVLVGMMESFYESIVRSLQEKTWDCDIEATKNFYQSQLFENPSVQPENVIPKDYSCYESEQMRSDRHYWHSYNEYYSHHEDRYEHVRLPKSFGHSYHDFVKRDSCFAGCYADSLNVCHEACHSACHCASYSVTKSSDNSCHNSCHSACHSACHDACHSACVSGRAR